MPDRSKSGARFLGIAAILFGVAYFADVKWVLVVSALAVVAAMAELGRQLQALLSFLARENLN